MHRIQEWYVKIVEKEKTEIERSGLKKLHIKGNNEEPTSGLLHYLKRVQMIQKSGAIPNWVHLFGAPEEEYAMIT